ncbi:WXG100 family type VII secretion target [Amycolatopsis jiangsuensis]|uniref:PPE family protein n=1 Tax=Amycolatopsis jiangsuensis TaxID=1181879 RepID=A0A840J3T8_9PSEU|nr:hypothetical protein [Amycolatopsis jiangsuensis]MBB4688389.1 hypothetical protein [Amycolatopsis jiangsuensis]
MSYSGTAFPQQAQMMAATAPLAGVAQQAAEMWKQAKTQLTGASSSLQQHLKALEPEWTDEAGGQLQQRGGRSRADIDSWTTGIDQTVQALGQLSGAITSTGQWFQQMTQLMQQNPLVAALFMEQLGQLGGQRLDQLAEQFRTATEAVRNTKGNDWSGPLGGGGSSTTSSGGRSSGGGQQGGSASGGGSSSGGDQAGGDQGEQSGGESGDDASGGDASDGSDTQLPGDESLVPDPGSGDPSLSGLGSAPAPIAPPTLPPLPAGPAPSLPGGLAMPMPGLGGIGGLGGGFGGVPGVKLGGGAKQLPQAAFPVTQQTTVPTSGEAPRVEEVPPPRPPGGSSGGGMPMTPMSGLAGAAGGGGGAPGSGAVHHVPAGRGARRTAPPGLPAALRGKSGRTDPAAFAPLARTARRDRADDGGKVEFLAEDLWQVDESGASALDQPTRPRRPTR